MARGSTKKDEKAVDLEVMQVTRGSFDVCVLGTTPLLFNSMPYHVKQGLLMPRKKTAADKAANLKHDPTKEFRESALRAVGDSVPTRLLLSSLAFKGALRSVATDIPGAVKAQIGRLTYIEGEYISIYGIPKLHMGVVRSADINHTPDIRTRAIIEKWCCRVRITYVTPLLRDQIVANLMAASGIMRGVGDFRPEKGAGSYGQFELVPEAHLQFQQLIKTAGRVAQDAALKDPECYNAESAELYTWFVEEAQRRGFKAVA